MIEGDPNKALREQYLTRLASKTEFGHNPPQSSFFENSAVLTVANVASLLQVSSRTVERLLNACSIPGGKKVGRKWVVSRLVFMEWLNESKEE